MKSDYELVINFCRAEMMMRTIDWVRVSRKGAAFEAWQIAIDCIGLRVTVEGPEAAKHIDRNNSRKYADHPKFAALAHLLDLRPKWIAVTDGLPESGKEYLVMLPDEHVQQAYLTDDRRWRASHHISKDRTIIADCEPAYYQPLPVRP